jgi:hypothetical protein
MKYSIRLFLLVFLLQPAWGQTCSDESITRLSDEAELVFLGEVEVVGNSWGFWSGIAPNLQKVQYKVIEVLKGQYSEAAISVGHLVVKNSSTADNDKARLSPYLFAHGNLLIVFVKKMDKADKNNFGDLGDDSYLSLDEHCGVISVKSKDSKTIRKIQRLNDQKQ